MTTYSAPPHRPRFPWRVLASDIRTCSPTGKACVYAGAGSVCVKCKRPRGADFGKGVLDYAALAVKI